MEADFYTILSDQRSELERTDLSKLVTRAEEPEIHLNSTLAQVVIGVRRSGKSTLCAKVMLQSGLPFGYVNFDDDRLGKLTRQDFDALLNALYRLNGDFQHLLLDEVQDIEGWELFVNRMLRQKMHLIITGSNANLLSGELATHLTGRYHQIELFPFSFGEYCIAQNVDITSHTTKAIALRERALEEYLFSGGLPELQTLPESEQDTYIRSLIQTIIEKDIARRYKVRYIQTLTEKIREYEIDFVIVDRSRVVELIQVTYDFTHPSVKQYNREVMHLVKAAKQFNCSNLTLIMMYGQQRDILIDGYTVHCVSAVDYLLH